MTTPTRDRHGATPDRGANNVYSRPSETAVSGPSGGVGSTRLRTAAIAADPGRHHATGLADAECAMTVREPLFVASPDPGRGPSASRTAGT